MREFVYLSDGKLNEFQPEPRRPLPVIKLHAGGSLAGLNVESPVSDGARERRRHLKRVEKEIALHASWYTEPTVGPGRWVRFEAPLTWATLRGRYQDLVLFVDPAPDSAQPVTAARRRLLLHGSARHLLGRPPAQVDGPALTGLEGGGHSAGTVFVTNAGHVISALAQVHDPLAAETGAPVVSAAAPTTLTTPLTRVGLRDLLAALDAEATEVSTSAVVGGYARVSAVLPETEDSVGCLVASPLTVEYID